MDVIALTQALVRMDTRNPPGDERACAQYVSDILVSGGLTVERHEFAPGRINLVARRGEAAAIALTGHLDTVPLGAAPWSNDPFGGEIVGDRLYGRGACDMKAGVAAMIVAALAEPAPVTLILTGGEETGADGARALAADGRLPEAQLLVVGEPTDNRLLYGHRGALWMRACYHGVTAHGSTPHLGDNAVYKAARGALSVETLQFNVPTHPVMGRPTVNLGMFSGGQNINSVPDRAEFTLDIRTIPGQDHARLRDEIGFVLGPDAELDGIIDLPPVWSDPELQLLSRAAAVYGAVTGRDAPPASANFFTDAGILTPAMGDVPTLICGPGDPAMAHKTDEYCALSRIHEATAFYRRLIAAFAA